MIADGGMVRCESCGASWRQDFGVTFTHVCVATPRDAVTLEYANATQCVAALRDLCKCGHDHSVDLGKAAGPDGVVVWKWEKREACPRCRLTCAHFVPGDFAISAF